MAERGGWFGGPVESVVFALIMVVAAFLGRENPRFVYPEVLFCFLGLLAFNLVNFSILPRLLGPERRGLLSVSLDILLLTLVLRFSGGADSYFWVLYLLPVFNGCLVFRPRGVLATASAALLPLVLFNVMTPAGRQWAGSLELLIKTAIIAASAFVVMRVAGREREARERLAEEERRIEAERVQTREQLQRMDRLATLGTLTAGVAHELNTPLTAILGFAQLNLGKEDLAAAETRRILGRIEAGVLRCRQIIQDLLSFSRQKKAQRKPCDVDALIRECVELKEHDCLSDRVRIETDLAGDLPRTLLSGSEFQQVIFNLLTNAHQAIRAAGCAEGRIRLRTRHEAGWIVVTVADNGPGVPAGIAERIWEPFFTTKAEGEGTGLGLAICRQIVEAQGGELSLEPNRGAGTSFLIRLPIVAAPAAAAEVSGEAGRRPLGQHVLAADDDPSVRDLVVRLLARYGVPVQNLGTFTELLAALRRAPPRLLVCDLHMPGMGVFDFFRRAEEDGLLAGIPVIVVSGSSPGPNVEAYIAQKGWPYLGKPFELRVFQAELDRILGLPGSGR